MRVIDRITGEQLTADEAYERFFDGFYNLGRPAEIFAGTMVLSQQRRDPVRTRRNAKTRRSGVPFRGSRHVARHK
ncbi:MAG TPA: hypothetical protein VFZ87_12075 [Gemmatimonadales bacterium]